MPGLCIPFCYLACPWPYNTTFSRKESFRQPRNKYRNVSTIHHFKNSFVLQCQAQKSWYQQLIRSPLIGLTFAGFLLTSQPSLSVEDFTVLQSTHPLADVAKIIGSERRPVLNQKLVDLEEQTGWKVRIATKQSIEQFQSPNLRSTWVDEVGDKKLSIIQIDTSAPNVIKFDYIGDDFIAPGGPLGRPFWIELQSRFGNIFYVREEGEAAVVENVVDSLSTCLKRPGGCRVVPGLPENQYIFTLILSVSGGIVCGFASKLQPAGFVKQRWIWVLLFSPLWGSLFISFGLGPIVSRTDDVGPLIINTTAFLATVLLFQVIKSGPLFPKEET
eukprot:TRINITY_DN8133_c1_g1_i4.p1 TRINITY_DN8133_c1_g1~~TRINITY_DN8133_c1_g1_i4.p1  ORF type:complete len:346 (-),score=-2.87 TRINITY_DN8133_c1_g1_i4:1086-2075(-)